jgi:CheY-like chemotaxis protein
VQQKILMVDDDMEELMLIEEALLSFDRVVHYEENGENALQYIKKCEALPALIILDLNMPKLNGTETLEKLKSDERLKSIPVVIYSTSVNALEKGKCLRLGACDYIIKPVTYADTMKTAKYFSDLCGGSVA